MDKPNGQARDVQQKQMPSPILGMNQPYATAHSGGCLAGNELRRKESGQP